MVHLYRNRLDSKCPATPPSTFLVLTAGRLQATEKSSVKEHASQQTVSYLWIIGWDRGTQEQMHVAKN